MEEKLLRLKDVMELLSVSRATVYRLVEQKKFPSYLKIGGSSYWRMSEIQKFIQNQSLRGA